MTLVELSAKLCVACPLINNQYTPIKGGCFNFDEMEDPNLEGKSKVHLPGNKGYILHEATKRCPYAYSPKIDTKNFNLIGVVCNLNKES